MIVTDLDGTLLRNDKTISDWTKQVLTECRGRGIKIVYATARSHVRGFVPDELFDGYVVKSGAAAYLGDERVYYKIMPIDDVRPLLLAAHAAGLQAVAQNDDGVHYSNFDVSKKWPYLANYSMVDFATIDFDVDKIYIVTETPESLKFVKNHVPAGLHLFISRDDLSFVFHKDAIKSKAVAALADRWGIDYTEIVAFGDDFVDAELLQFCGIGVAVANAIDSVKVAADFVCDTNENDGVAKWLESNLLSHPKSI